MKIRTKYITVFNQEIQEISKSMPLAFQRLLDNFPDKKWIKDHYQFFDEISSIVGVSIGTKQLIDEKKDKTIGFYPIFRFKPNNIFGKGPNEVKQCEALHSIDACYKILARKLVYLLMTKYSCNIIEVSS